MTQAPPPRDETKKLAARARQQAAVADIGRRALEEEDLEALLREAAESVARTLGVEFSQALELLPGEGALLLKAGVGWSDGLVGAARVPAGRESQAGFTIETAGPVIVEDLKSGSRFPGSSILHAHGVESGMSVCIPGRGHPFGVLAVHSRRRHEFSEDDAHFLQGVAHVLAAAIQRKRGDESLRQSQDALRQAQKLEAIGRLAGGVAHDFNNLLTTIMGYSELLIGQTDPRDPAHADLKEIYRAGERAATLTRQLLAFSRRQILQPAVLDLNELISNLEKMLRRVIGEDIELRTVLGPDLGRVLVDPGQIEQVLMNLAVNARDAMPNGGKLTVETSNVVYAEPQVREKYSVAPGAYTMAAVSDTGIGMDPETLSHLFEPFFTTKERGKGTGLGLSTCYGIVKQSGGYIWAASVRGRGSVFLIILPQVEAPAVPLRPAEPRSELPRGTETILLVEDEESVRTVGRTILKKLGYAVLEATNGLHGLQVSEAHGGVIDLLLTDVVMPTMTGDVLAERLSTPRPKMKVLFLSGYTDRNLADQGTLLQGRDLLVKPFTAGTLARRVREVLDGPRGRERTEAST